MQPQMLHSWKDRRKQRHKRNIFGSAAFLIIIAIILTLILIAIGAFSPVIGTAIIAGVALFITFLAWRFPRPSPPSPQDTSASQPVVLQATGTTASVLPAIPVLSSNPFSALGKLLDPNDFYGRVSERNILIERTRRKASTSIVGPRRIGKTWLMQYLMLISQTELGSTYYMVEMSAHSATCNTLVEFADYILRELKGQAHAGTEVSRILENAITALEKEQAKAEPNTLAILEKTIRDLSKEAIIPVLCIDEFNSIANSPQRKKQFNLGFFRSLRTMADSQNMNLVLVIASQDPLKRIVGRIGRESGFFNIFDQIRVRPFSLTEAEDFIQTKGDQAQFTDLERDYLLKLSGKGCWLWRKYWPIRLELIGEAIWADRSLGSNYYQAGDKQYWKNLKRNLAKKSVF